MGSLGLYAGDVHQLVGLRVVRDPNWEWGAQNGGEGFVGTVIGVFGKPKYPKSVKVRWDTGEEFVYRIATDGSCNLRVLDNSIIGVKHFGVKCQGCGMDDIAGLRWQCLDCTINLCTFCFTNGKHDQSHVNFNRYDRPSSDPIRVILDKSNIQLKGFFPGALVRRGKDWKYGEEDRFSSIGTVVSVPTQLIPGEVWVKWPHENLPFSYRVGFNGKVDLELVKAGIGGHYQPHTLPVLKISKQRTDEKSIDGAVPLVVGDTVKFSVGSLEELRKMAVNCGLEWDADDMKKVMNDVGRMARIGKLDDGGIVKVEFIHSNIFCWFPEKAICRLIPWLPVGAMVQVSNGSDTMELPHDVMVGDFGCIKKVQFDGKNVDMEFVKPNGRVVHGTLHVNQLKSKPVDMSVIKKEELIKKDLAKLLVSAVEEGTTLSVDYLLKKYPNIVNCRSSYNKRSCTALSVACQEGNVEKVNLLLQYNASVDMEDIKEEENKKEQIYAGLYDLSYDEEDEDDAGDLPIHHAVLGNHPEILRLLLEKGASPNVIGKRRRTPLHLAARNGYVECARILLTDQRCDPNLKDRLGETALRLAVESPVQSFEMFNLFHATGNLKINEENYKKLIPLAARYNYFGAAKFLLSFPEGKELAKRIFDLEEDTPLHEACKDGHNEMVKLFLSNVKDENGKPWGIDRQGWRGLTPLMIAIEECNYELIECLIEAGANLQATDKEGKTAFNYAAIFWEHSRKYKKWPNDETSPEIFKIYNELNTKFKTKNPDEILHPSAAVVFYIVAKGGIQKNMTGNVVQRTIDDEFLYGEILNEFPDIHLNFQSIDHRLYSESESEENEDFMTSTSASASDEEEIEEIWGMEREDSGSSIPRPRIPSLQQQPAVFSHSDKIKNNQNFRGVLTRGVLTQELSSPNVKVVIGSGNSVNPQQGTISDLSQKFTDFNLLPTSQSFSREDDNRTSPLSNCEEMDPNMDNEVHDKRILSAGYNGSTDEINDEQSDGVALEKQPHQFYTNQHKNSYNQNSEMVMEPDPIEENRGVISIRPTQPQPIPSLKQQIDEFNNVLRSHIISENVNQVSTFATESTATNAMTTSSKHIVKVVAVEELHRKDETTSLSTTPPTINPLSPAIHLSEIVKICPDVRLNSQENGNFPHNRSTNEMNSTTEHQNSFPLPEEPIDQINYNQNSEVDREQDPVEENRGLFPQESSSKNAMGSGPDFAKPQQFPFTDLSQDLEGLDAKNLPTPNPGFETFMDEYFNDESFSCALPTAVLPADPPETEPTSCNTIHFVTMATQFTATNAMTSNSSWPSSNKNTAEGVAVKEQHRNDETTSLSTAPPTGNPEPPDIHPVTAGDLQTDEEVTCTIQRKTFKKRNKDGTIREEITTYILVDEYGRRYSQQKKTVTDIFQCTSNVLKATSEGTKKCIGTIFVEDLKRILEEWKTDPGRNFTFKVRNRHEEHLPGKRGRSSIASSVASSTGNIRSRKMKKS